MKITIIGKIGCIKCTKMDMILRSKGHETSLVYMDKIASLNIRGKHIDITNDTVFPIYVTDNGVFDNYKKLIEKEPFAMAKASGKNIE